MSIFGFGLCHQFPERSFDFAAVQWAVCARCSGIYVGLAAVLISLVVAFRKQQRHGFMAWPYWIFLAAGLAFMGWDGVSSYAGWRETTNFLRWVTGIGMGASLAPLLYFLLVNNLAKRSFDKPVMGGGARPWIAVAIGMVAAFVVVYPAGPLLGALSAIIAALAMWFTFSLLILVVLGVLKPFYRTVEGWRNLIVPGLIASVLGLLLILSFSFLSALVLAT